MVGGLVGGTIGIACGLGIGRKWLRWSTFSDAVTGAVVGTMAGRLVGRRVAVWSRKRAAELILEGNKTVLWDIGTQSARFLELIETGASPEKRAEFFAGLRSGPTEYGGQDRLAKAFRSYLIAFDSSDLQERNDAMIVGNCEIVYHEHIRLDPYIRQSMPVIVRRCATKRLMEYEIGDVSLSVGDDIPGLSITTAAKDWTSIEERMRYVFALFRKFHESPEVFEVPKVAIEHSAIKAQLGIRRLYGKVKWEGNLEESRRMRFPDWDKD